MTVQEAMNILITQLKDPYHCNVKGEDVVKLETIHILTGPSERAILSDIRQAQSLKSVVMKKLKPILKRGFSVEEIISSIEQEQRQ